MMNTSVCDFLELERYDVKSAGEGFSAREMLLQLMFDLVILDWQIPNVTGIELLREFRASGRTTPVLLLTGKGAIHEKEEGFNAGADDYLTKPFHPRELGARVKALLRRPTAYASDVLKVGPLELEPNIHRLRRDGKEIQLQPMEFALLEFLMRHKGQVFGIEALLQRVWSSDAECSLDAIYTCIKRLRKKIDPPGDKSIIRTVHGVGYKLETD